MKPHIKYRNHIKYQLLEEYHIQTNITGYCFETPYMRMEYSGLLKIFYKYTWDGPSGPVPDIPSTMRASLVHDALYQAMRLGFIPLSERDKADRMFQAICVEDGVVSVVAWAMYQALRKYGEPNAMPGTEPPPIIAP